MQSTCTLSLIVPSFASEVRTATVGHLWRHSPFVFFVWASESWWVLTPPICVRTSLMVAARIRKLVVRTHMRFDKPVSSMIW